MRNPATDSSLTYLSSIVQVEVSSDLVLQSGSFPLNGDIRMHLGHDEGDDLLLHKTVLSAASTYFAGFENKGWPGRFQLERVPEDSCPVLMPSSLSQTTQLDMGLPPDHQDLPNVLKEVARIALKMLYRLPISFVVEDHDPMQILLTVARLLGRLGALKPCIDTLISALCTAPGLGLDRACDTPYLFLEIAIVLENEKLIGTALAHAAGRTPISHSTIDRMCTSVAEIVLKSSADLDLSLENIVETLFSPPRGRWSFSDWVAFNLYKQHMAAKLDKVEDNSVGLFIPLYALLGDTSANVLNSPEAKKTLDASQSVNTGLLTGYDYVNEVHHRHEEESVAIRQITVALDEALTVENIEKQVKFYISFVNKTLKPLFTNVGSSYFTYNGPLPGSMLLSRARNQILGQNTMGSGHL